MTVSGSTDRCSFFLIDAYPMYRLGLRSLIEGAGWSVSGEADDVESALPLLQEAGPDVVVSEFRVNREGVASLRRLLASGPLRVLATGNHEERLCATACLAAGALCYLEKREPADVVLEALRKVLAGELYGGDALTSLALAGVSSGRRTFVLIDSLTGRESDVYRLLGQGLSIKQIASVLGISPKTVEYHRQRLKGKLQLDSGAALYRHAMANPLEEAEEEASTANL